MGKPLSQFNCTPFSLRPHQPQQQMSVIRAISEARISNIWCQKSHQSMSALPSTVDIAESDQNVRHEIRCQYRQFLIFAKSPSIFDCYIRSLSESRFAQTLMKWGEYVQTSTHVRAMSALPQKRTSVSALQCLLCANSGHRSLTGRFSLRQELCRIPSIVKLMPSALWLVCR